MSDLFTLIIPALFGLLSGIFAPMIVERWKGTKEDIKKLILLESDVAALQESLKSLETRMDEKISGLENELKEVEIKLSHNAGLIQGRLPDIPAEAPTTSS